MNWTATTNESLFSLCRSGHILAGSILILFGLSHVFSLLTSMALLKYSNPVFPFLKNSTFFGFAGVLQLTIGGGIILNRGKTLAVSLLIAIIGGILWYKWAYDYAGGGMRCGCAGILGHLLDISKQNERFLASAALTLLTLCLIPSAITWWYSKQRRGITSIAQLLPFLIPFACLGADTSSGSTVVIEGQVTSSFLTGSARKPDPSRTSTNTFIAYVNSNKTWRINIKADPLIGPWSADLYFNGKDTYYLRPTVLVTEAKAGVRQLPNDKLWITDIYPGPLFLPFADDPCGMAALWIAYCSGFASTIETNRSWPIPWKKPRLSLSAYGYDWVITNSQSTASTRFASAINIVRNKSLDLPESEEFLRPTLLFPRNTIQRQKCEEGLVLRLDKPNGDLAGTFRVSAWVNVGELQVPKSSHLKAINWRLPTYEAQIEATSVVLVNRPFDTMPPVPSVEMAVSDYRYAMRDEQRIFDAANYSLDVGESWRGSDDSNMLARAERYMREGGRISEFGLNKKHYFTWGVLLLVLAGSWYFAVMCKKPKTERLDYDKSSQPE